MVWISFNPAAFRPGYGTERALIALGDDLDGGGGA